MSATYYVAGLLFGDVRSKVLLIRKSHPDWMKGKLNGVGGHIETDKDERPLQAMRREFTEETGLNIGAEDWHKFAVLVGDEETSDPWWIHWYTASIHHTRHFNPQAPFENCVVPPQLDEPVNWYEVEALTRGLHSHMMPNLLWLIYMAKARLEGAERALGFHITEKYEGRNDYSTE